MNPSSTFASAHRTVLHDVVVQSPWRRASAAEPMESPASFCEGSHLRRRLGRRQAFIQRRQQRRSNTELARSASILRHRPRRRTAVSSVPLIGLEAIRECCGDLDRPTVITDNARRPAHATGRRQSPRRRPSSPVVSCSAGRIDRSDNLPLGDRHLVTENARVLSNAESRRIRKSSSYAHLSLERRSLGGVIVAVARHR